MALSDVSNAAMVHPEHWVFCMMPHPPPTYLGVSLQLEPTNTLFIYIYTITTSFITKISRVMSSTSVSSAFRRGPNAGLRLIVCPTPPLLHGLRPCPHWRLWAPAAACVPLATPASEGPNSLGC